MKTDKKDTKEKNNTYNANITKDDKQALGSKELRADLGDDRLLKDRKEPVDFSGKDLDVPGRNKPNAHKKNTITDEENSLFGQGGEDNENLEAPERANTKASQ